MRSAIARRAIAGAASLCAAGAVLAACSSGDIAGGGGGGGGGGAALAVAPLAPSAGPSLAPPRPGVAAPAGQALPPYRAPIERSYDRPGMFTFISGLTLYNRACLKSGVDFAAAPAVFAASEMVEITDTDIVGNFDDRLYGVVTAGAEGAKTCFVIIEEAELSTALKAMDRLIERKYGVTAFEVVVPPPFGVYRMWRRRGVADGPILAVSTERFFDDAVFGVAFIAGAPPDFTPGPAESVFDADIILGPPAATDGAAGAPPTVETGSTGQAPAPDGPGAQQ